MLHPSLKNGPKACQDPNAWKTKAKVRYPYKGVDQAELVVAPTLSGLTALDKSFDTPRGAVLPPGSLGYDSGAEKAYHKRLKDLANDGSTFPFGPTGPRKSINDLAKLARDYLNLVDDYYANDGRRTNFPMTKQMALGDDTGFGPATPGTLTGRNNLRHDIVDAYRNAAQLLWCTEYGMAEIDAYLQNREAFEAPIKPSPGGLVDPAWTNYTPVEYQGVTWDVGGVDLPEVDTTPPEDIEGEGVATSGATAGIALGALAIGALFLLSRR